MDLLDAIKNRRSIHVFKEEKVPEELLTKIFSYATYAPTHYMTESWNVKIFENGGKTFLIDKLMNSYERLGMLKTESKEKTLKMRKSMSQFLHNIPHHALIYMPKQEDPVRYEEEYASVSAFIQNAQLVAWKFGVGMLWTITPYMHDPEFYREIGLNSETEKIVAVLQIGYPKKIPKKRERTPIEEKLTYVREK